MKCNLGKRGLQALLLSVNSGNREAAMGRNALRAVRPAVLNPISKLTYFSGRSIGCTNAHAEVWVTVHVRSVDTNM